uniref:Uncharacterized protein n=1 Tax=Brassica oleracea var. oleracea TaxID=109376 RepID=A0A0D2ZQ59_BRAOL
MIAGGTTLPVKANGQLRPGAYRRQKRQADRCSPKADRATHPKLGARAQSLQTLAIQSTLIRRTFECPANINLSNHSRDVIDRAAGRRMKPGQDHTSAKI